MNEDITPEQALDPLLAPTNEYSMRNAANLLADFARAKQDGLSQGEIDTLNFAYQQLHRGANTLRAAIESTK